ncbi:glycosyltransferase [Falsigemmobacter intermedius]|uniref:MraY family glycosyltransferase n=1 Tax=Falsigemmobacter intermedius TaxID=1553448 RepID=UPI001F4F5C25|nr:glycosyltransferase [Falsigemmobacter intermedius]
MQKLHVRPTPRIGGIALVAGAVVSMFLLGSGAAALWGLICLTAIPAFLAGLIEDLTKQVGVKTRLCATIVSGLLFCMISGYAVRKTAIPGLDVLFGFAPFAVLFTAVAIGGIANAINIIDGVNGLASGAVIIILLGFAVVAGNAGDMPLQAICLVAAGSILGFFLLNYPMGLIFFGDAGAYTAGFVLAVVAVLLPARNPELSPLIGLLALSYPVMETLVSIHRRLVREGTNPGQPDRLHLHSLVYRSFARRAAQAIGLPAMRNPMTSTVMWFFPFLSALLCVLAAQSTIGVVLSIGLVGASYLLAYRRVALLRPIRRREEELPA